MKGVKESGKGSGGNRKERILGRRKKGVRRKENSRMKVGKRGGGVVWISFCSLHATFRKCKGLQVSGM